MAVKGLITPLSRWLQGSWLFVQALGDLRVVSYWIDTLVLKNWGKYLCYFAASPFPLQGKTNACSRGSKKDFWRRCGGDLRQVKTYQVPITTLILRIALFPICLSFSSPPLHLRLFFAPLPFDLVLPCDFFLLASSLAKSLWILIHLLIFLRDPIIMNLLLVRSNYRESF